MATRFSTIPSGWVLFLAVVAPPLQHGTARIFMSDEKALKSQARMNEEIHRTRTGSVSYTFNIATRIRGSEGPSVSTERLIPTSFPNPFICKIAEMNA